MEDNKKNNLMVVNLSQVDLPNANYTESIYKDWINYGTNNEFPLLLIDLLNRSALHNSIISSKVDTICGGGIYYEKKKDSKTEKAVKDAKDALKKAEDALKKAEDDSKKKSGFNNILSVSRFGFSNINEYWWLRN